MSDWKVNICPLVGFAVNWNQAIKTHWPLVNQCWLLVLVFSANTCVIHRKHIFHKMYNYILNSLGTNELTEPIRTWFSDIYMRNSASMLKPGTSKLTTDVFYFQHLGFWDVIYMTNLKNKSSFPWVPIAFFSMPSMFVLYVFYVLMPGKYGYKICQIMSIICYHHSRKCWKVSWYISYWVILMAHCSHGYLWTHDIEVGASWRDCDNPELFGTWLHHFAYRGRTSNGSWCIGIKGEISGTVCVTFTWDIYIYMSCL